MLVTVSEQCEKKLLAVKQEEKSGDVSLTCICWTVGFQNTTCNIYVILVNKLINYVPKKTLILTYRIGIIERQCVLCCQLQIADFFLRCWLTKIIFSWHLFTNEIICAIHHDMLFDMDIHGLPNVYLLPFTFLLIQICLRWRRRIKDFKI